MGNLKNLLKILKAIENMAIEINVPKKQILELKMLIECLEDKTDTDISIIIEAIKNANDTSIKEKSKRRNSEDLKNIYKKVYLNEPLSEEENEIKKNFKKDNLVINLLEISEKEVLELINDEKSKISMEILKIISYARFGIDLKSKKSKNVVRSEIKMYISQKNYYNNMEKAYKK